MTNELALWLSIGAGGLAILFGVVSTQWVLKQPAGTDRMQEIAAAIQEGAKAYMNRQYFTISIVGIVLCLVLGVVLDWATAIGFAIGAIFSGLAGYIGMYVSVRANVRTAEAATKGVNPAFWALPAISSFCSAPVRRWMMPSTRWWASLSADR
jgi:K(+)-stimulated pyrophosphate-energized sodium pump